jgi:SAM-dependent methyltransferase
MIQQRTGIEVQDCGGVSIYLPEQALSTSDRREFVANARFEESLAGRPKEMIVFDDILFKANFIKTFQKAESLIQLAGKERILELGASHGWASAMIKRKWPGSYVIASDLVADTVRHAERWEQMLGCRIDEKWAFNIRDSPFDSGQFDRIFTFASFHHFGFNGDFRPALTEMNRLLVRGGRIVLLYEPSSPDYLYPFAYRRVNRRRKINGVDEDVIRLSHLRNVAAELDLTMHCDFFTEFEYRSSISSTLYYLALSKLPLLQKLLVCTVNVTIKKQRTRS